MIVVTRSSLDTVDLNRTHVEIKYSEEYIKKPQGEAVFELAETGRTWTVVYDSYISLRRNRVWFMYDAWHCFAKDANLKVGDICAFELMELDLLRLKVTILLPEPKRTGHRSSHGVFEKGESSRRNT